MSHVSGESVVSERDLFASPAIAVSADPDTHQPARPAQIVRKAEPWRRVLSASAGLSADLRLELERGAVALIVPIGLGAGSFAYLAARFEPAWLPILAGLLISAVIALATRHRPAVHILALSAALLFGGAVAAKFETWRKGTQVIGGEISTRLTGRVVDIDHLSSGRLRLVLDVLDTQRPKLRYQPQRVRVSASSLPDGVVAGAVVEGVARLQPPPGPIRPGGYDFSFESYFDGTGANGFFLGKPQLVASNEPVPLSIRIGAALDNARNAIAGRIRSAIGRAEGEIAAALIVGVRAGIPEDVNEALRRTGLAHILSISGLHMALVAASVMVALRAGMALIPGFAATHPTKKYAAAAALLVLSAYLLVSGVEVAALRSFIMLAVMLIAVMFDRQALTMRNLAIAAIIILLITPHEIVGPSFQMSFAATAALIGGYGAWSERSRKRPGRAAIAEASASQRVLKWAWLALVGTLATAIIAGLATAIYGIWHFQRVSPLTLVANLAVTPIVSLLVMLFGLLATLAMPFGLDGSFLVVMGFGLKAMLAVAEYLSTLSPVDSVGLVPAGSVVLLTVSLLIGTLATTRIRYLALPVALMGLAVIPSRRLPDILISEDARLVAVKSATHQLLVNRSRPNGFTVEGWQRAALADQLVKPVMETPAKADDTAEKKPADPKARTQEIERLDYDAANRLLQTASTDAFRCQGPLCVVRLESFGLIAVAANAWTAQQVCRETGLVIVQEAKARANCANGKANIITAKMLARQGAASIVLRDLSGAAINPAGLGISYAIAEPFRPWHHHRQFSRAARGMEAYRRTPRVAGPTQNNAAPADNAAPGRDSVSKP